MNGGGRVVSRAWNVYARQIVLIAALMAALSAMLAVGAERAGAQEAGTGPVSLDLVVPDKPFPFLPGALPDAGGTVTVTPSEGADEFAIDLAGLPPNAEYVVFLTETPTAPFGDLEYLLDVTTDETGSASGTARAVVFDAFALTGSASDGKPDVEAIRASKTELDNIVVWPAEPGTTAPLFEAQGEMPVISPFDDDLEAGPAILSSSNDPAAVSPLASTTEGAAVMPETGGAPLPALMLAGGASLALMGTLVGLSALRRRTA